MIFRNNQSKAKQRKGNLILKVRVQSNEPKNNKREIKTNKTQNPINTNKTTIG